MADEQPQSPKSPKKHLIKPTWLRRTLKTLLGIVIFILILPFLLYIPPVQDLVVKIATNVVEKSTGMKVGIGAFRLSFPLDVHLKDVYVVEAQGDTMVKARDLVADVKLLPLFKLDVDVNKLQLIDGYYRMLSADSSMLMRIDAGFLEVDDKSSVDIRKSEILLNKTTLRDGRVSLYMDVWKKKTQPEDTTSSSAPFVIKANDLALENFTFGMSMLPTIDTLSLALDKVALRDAVIDLGENVVKWKTAAIDGGDITYLTPTEEYIKTHPAPPPEPSTGPPMRIIGDSIAVDNVSALYAVKDARPLPGFDASYLQVSDVNIGMRDFYNESSTIRLPLTRLQARERCGLQIVEGHGTVAVDSIGLTLDGLAIRTPFSSISATADVPFEMMALNPNVAMSADANGRIGLPDVEAFMPSLKPMLSAIPARTPLDFTLVADGSLADIKIDNLSVAMPGIFSLKADGFARNPLDYKKLIAQLSFDASLSNPAVADKLIGLNDINLPSFRLEGTAEANGLSYGADFKLLSDAGDVAADGHVALTPEIYRADITATRLDVGRFMPSLGIGKVSAIIKANGRGFNPLDGTAVTDAVVNISSIEYNHRNLEDIFLSVNLSDEGVISLAASSPNAGLDFDIHGEGTIHPDNYAFDLSANLRDVNLLTLGLTDSTCYGSGYIDLRGTAQPEKWIYDVELNVRALEWNLPDRFIHLPDGLTASVKTDPFSTSLYLNSLLTSVDFHSPVGPEGLIKSFTDLGELVAGQIKNKNLEIDRISEIMPEFSLDVNASGAGLLQQFLQPSGLSVDTIYGQIGKDSLIRGDINVMDFSTGSLTLDTLSLNLLQRGNLLDYKVHLGNRPGTFDEFARVNLNGYVGANRVSAYLNQWNIKGEQGYKIGLTAALMDSTVTVHITPLKSVIAYLPWTFNNDNFVDFNLLTKHVEANLLASSEESSILAKTQIGRTGKEELNVKIDNLHIQDFLQMWAAAPPIKGDLNTDLHVLYDNNRFMGGGTVSFHDFYYEKTRVGDFDLGLGAAYGLDASTDVRASLKINGDKALTAYANLRPDDRGELKADSIGLSLTRFPLKIANPFLGNSAQVGGFLNGDMRMDGSFTAPRLNGAIEFDSVSVKIPMLGADLKFNDDRVSVVDNIISLHDFDIYAANNNPLVLEGTVDATRFTHISVNLAANASNFQLVNSDKRSKADLYGKVFLNLNATAKGPLSLLDINATANLLGTTDATYRLDMDASTLTSQSDQDVVKFVNFNDTAQIAKVDTIEQSSVNMRINAKLSISPGTHLAVLLGSDGEVQIAPNANLSYYQNYMGDMTLNGTLTLGEGFAKYNVPVLGEKTFNFNPASTITWTGAIANPVLNVTATDEIKASVKTDGNSRLANFLVTLHATDHVDNLKLAFDLSTNDDLSLQNELQSMSADQRQTQAMNLLLYGQYTGQNTSAKAAGGNMLYSFLESQLNSWAAKNIRGVDLSFGVNQYDKTSNGVTNTETSYSYQVSKSLFNNRFKIQVGGNYSTDTDDSDIAENLISDVSVEYILKQTQTTDMAVRLFRHIGYESILEGEITEMGVGFVMKRRLENLKSLFRIRWGKPKNRRSEVHQHDRDAAAVPKDSTATIKKED